MSQQITNLLQTNLEIMEMNHRLVGALLKGFAQGLSVQESLQADPAINEGLAAVKQAAIDLVTSRNTHQEDEPQKRRALHDLMLKHGMLLAVAGSYGDITHDLAVRALSS